jgi:hypothetical protein
LKLVTDLDDGIFLFYEPHSGSSINAAKMSFRRIGHRTEDLDIPFPFFGHRSVVGWFAGSSIDSEDTMSFSVLSGVRSMNEVFPTLRILFFTTEGDQPTLPFR